jgi:ketosteroid isomerase-like protein
MLRTLLLSMASFGVAVAAAPPRSGAPTQSKTQSMILAMERAALDRSDKGDPGGFLEISDPDVTYFDPLIEEPIHGLEALRAYYRQWPALAPSKNEMTNAKVQVSGEVAVLTFNYTSKTPKGVVRWNTTEVYRRGAKGWRIIHTHWAYRKPQLAPAN